MAATTLEKPKQAKGAKKPRGNAAPKRVAAKASASRANALSGTKTVQMNVRIDEETKEAGDAAFARIGLTPSQAVRLLWDFASRHANDPEALRNFLGELDEGQADSTISNEQTRRIEALREGWALIDSFRKEHNLVCAVPEDDDEKMAYYEQLREEALWERLEKRGLL